MKSLVEFIYEWKDDLTPQIIIIMGTPGCGKTFWMQHNGVKFFKDECGITLNPMELDIDHTLKKFQLEEFPNFTVFKFLFVSILRSAISLFSPIFLRSFAV